MIISFFISFSFCSTFRHLVVESLNVKGFVVVFFYVFTLMAPFILVSIAVILFCCCCFFLDLKWTHSIQPITNITFFWIELQKKVNMMMMRMICINFQLTPTLKCDMQRATKYIFFFGSRIIIIIIIYWWWLWPFLFFLCLWVVSIWLHTHK